MERFISNNFRDNTDSTLGAAFNSKKINYNNNLIKYLVDKFYNL